MNIRRGFALVLSALSIYLIWLAFGKFDQAPVYPPAPDAVEYQVRDWHEAKQSKLNISLYTFRDRNRNGRYDIGDLPMGSVAVRLDRPDSTNLTHYSNINGFTNFEMSYQRDEADISLAGQDYSLDVQVPPGWTITTGNGKQVLRLQHVEGSVTGLAAERAPQMVGLAADLSISGRVELVAGSPWTATDIQLLASGPQGSHIEVAIRQSGAFTIAVEPGAWSISAKNNETGEVLLRDLIVSEAPVQLAALKFGQPLAGTSALPFIQDFEYLLHSTIDKIPGGTGGLDWDYLVAVDNQIYRGPGFVNILRSGKHVGYNSSGHPVTITPAPESEYFDFVGAWFGSAWPSAHGEILVVEAWRGDQAVAREELSLSYLGPIWLDADFRNIDKLTLATKHYWQFVTEDMIFRVEPR